MIARTNDSYWPLERQVLYSTVTVFFGAQSEKPGTRKGKHLGNVTSQTLSCPDVSDLKTSLSEEKARLCNSN